MTYNRNEDNKHLLHIGQMAKLVREWVEERERILDALEGCSCAILLMGNRHMPYSYHVVVEI